jgi:hypothetical protein
MYVVNEGSKSGNERIGEASFSDVFDRYDVKNSIKSAERERRTKVTAHTKVFQVIEGCNIPDWKKFLSVKENKQALINFFGDFIVKFNQPLYGQSLWYDALFQPT